MPQQTCQKQGLIRQSTVIVDSPNFLLSQYLAILFFLDNYKGSLPNLPGVENDEKELKEVLKMYKKVITKDSKNILEDVQDIVQDQVNKKKELERVHFHFSGRY